MWSIWSWLVVVVVVLIRAALVLVGCLLVLSVWQQVLQLQLLLALVVPLVDLTVQQEVQVMLLYFQQ
jgi:hypothetical protein